MAHLLGYARVSTGEQHPHLQVGWELLWTHRLRRELVPIFRLVACQRGRHRDAHVVADDLLGGTFTDDYPEVTICEVCGRAVLWPTARRPWQAPGHG